MGVRAALALGEGGCVLEGVEARLALARDVRLTVPLALTVRPRRSLGLADSVASVPRAVPVAPAALPALREGSHEAPGARAVKVASTVPLGLPLPSLALAVCAALPDRLLVRWAEPVAERESLALAVPLVHMERVRGGEGVDVELAALEEGEEVPTRAGPEGVHEALTLRAAETLLGAVLSALRVREPRGALLVERAAVALALPVLLTELQPEALLRGLLERVPVAAAEAVEHREEDTVPEPLPRELLLLSPVALPVGMVARALPVTPRLPVASLVGLLARPLRVGLSCVSVLGADGEGERERVMLPLTLRVPPPPLLALTVRETERVSLASLEGVREGVAEPLPLPLPLALQLGCTASPVLLQPLQEQGTGAVAAAAGQ